MYLHDAISRIARKYCEYHQPEITYLHVEKEKKKKKKELLTKVKRKILMQNIDRKFSKNALYLNWVSTLMGSKSDKPQWKTHLNLLFSRKKIRHFQHTLRIDRPYCDAKT